MERRCAGHAVLTCDDRTTPTGSEEEQARLGEALWARAALEGELQAVKVRESMRALIFLFCGPLRSGSCRLFAYNPRFPPPPQEEQTAALERLGEELRGAREAAAAREVRMDGLKRVYVCVVVCSPFPFLPSFKFNQRRSTRRRWRPWRRRCSRTSRRGRWRRWRPLRGWGSWRGGWRRPRRRRRPRCVVCMKRERDKCIWPTSPLTPPILSFCMVVALGQRLDWQAELQRAQQRAAEAEERAAFLQSQHEGGKLAAPTIEQEEDASLTPMAAATAAARRASMASLASSPPP